MPKISPDRSEARRRHIIDSARTVFAVNGFASTSMARLAEETGVSVGNLYQYFPSKSALIGAIVAGRDGTHDQQADGEPVEAMLRRLLAYVEGSGAGLEHARVVTHIWSAAAADTEIAALAIKRHSALRDNLAHRLSEAMTTGTEKGLSQDASDIVLASLIGVAALRSSGYVLTSESVIRALSGLLPDETI